MQAQGTSLSLDILYDMPLICIMGEIIALALWVYFHCQEAAVT